MGRAEAPPPPAPPRPVPAPPPAPRPAPVRALPSPGPSPSPPLPTPPCSEPPAPLAHPHGQTTGLRLFPQQGRDAGAFPALALLELALLQASHYPHFPWVR